MPFKKGGATAYLTPQQLKAVGIAVFGPRNQRLFAEALGISHGHLVNLLQKKSPINKKYAYRSRDLVMIQATKLFELANKLDQKIDEIATSDKQSKE